MFALSLCHLERSATQPKSEQREDKRSRATFEVSDGRFVSICPAEIPLRAFAYVSGSTSLHSAQNDTRWGVAVCSL